MIECEQFPGMNVLEHGRDVNRWFMRILFGDQRDKLPKWGEGLIDDLLDMETIRLYQTYHDCGKHLCRIVDEAGKQHFPNHAEVSANLWESLGGSRIISHLMRHDMDSHTLRAPDAFWSIPEASTLLLTGLAEIYSNANHLGQLDSAAFKIKLKRLNRLGKHAPMAHRLSA
jgi:hypothetical protein